MKVTYKCEKCGKEYEDAEKASACEERHEVELEERKRARAVRRERENEINNLIGQYVKDYGSYPIIKMTVSNKEISERPWKSIFDFIY